MIKKDQPTIFDSSVIAAVSSLSDGNMKFGVGDERQVIQNRHDFLEKVGITIDQTTRVAITYNTDDFAKYRHVTANDKADGMRDKDSLKHADALATDQVDHALFLPIADCVGVVLHDPVRHVLMVSHIGRHSAEIDGGAKSVRYLIDTYNVDPKNLRAWLSPAVGSDTYPLHTFDGQSLHNVIVSQLLSAYLVRDHIQVSAIDTAVDDNYFSHSEYLKDSSQPSGRFAVVAMMRMQGEPAS